MQLAIHMERAANKSSGTAKYQLELKKGPIRQAEGRIPKTKGVRWYGWLPTTSG